MAGAKRVSRRQRGHGGGLEREQTMQEHVGLLSHCRDLNSDKVGGKPEKEYEEGSDETV